MDQVGNFSPERLTLAREKRRLTKQQLADLCGVTRRTVTSWERGDIESPPVALLAEVLGFPGEYFLSGDPVTVAEDAVSFRALSSASARQARSAMASASIAVELSDWIDAHYRLPSVAFPDYSESAALKPVIAAEELRHYWGLNQGPIKSMFAVLERNGVRIFSLPDQDREIDAFSFWHEEHPFILLNTDRSTERQSFDLAHELGHLVLHRGLRLGRSKQMEQEANDFASTFLVPADLLYPQVVGELQYADVFKLKKYWRISAMAMVERLWRLELVSEWTRRKWIIDLTKQGYRSGEPDGLPGELSKLIRQLLEHAREDGWNLVRLARAVRVAPRDVDALLFGLGLAVVEGQGRTAPRVVGHLRRIQ